MTKEGSPGVSRGRGLALEAEGHRWSGRMDSEGSSGECPIQAPAASLRDGQHLNPCGQGMGMQDRPHCCQGWEGSAGPVMEEWAAWEADCVNSM